MCLTHESTTHFFDRINEPWTTILTQRRRIQEALSTRRARLRLEAMDSEMPDVCVCVFVPDLWIEPLVNPPDHQSTIDNTQTVACPECHRSFQQAGTLKRHMRQVHQVPYEPDDIVHMSSLISTDFVTILISIHVFALIPHRN